MNEFRLIETMRVSELGEVHLLERHLDRLHKSAEYFSFKCDLAKIREKILQAIPRHGKIISLRLMLAADGVSTVKAGPMPIGYAKRLKLSTVRVNSDDLFLRHKTT